MTVGPCIETERLQLRWLTRDDAELMLAIWNDPGFVQHVGDRGIRTLSEAQSALETGALQQYRDCGYGPFKVMLADGTAIGICGLFSRDCFDWPDIGFTILPAWCRRGFAHESAVAVLRHARETLKLPGVYAIVSPGNRASVNLIEKLGLRFERLVQMPDESESIRLYALPFHD